MTRLTLESEPLTLELDPEYGCCLTGLWIKGPADTLYPILRPAPSVLNTPLQSSCYLLAPWSNRINKAAFVFDGTTHKLTPNFPDGSAIHGDVNSRPWTISDRTPVSARMIFESTAHEDMNFPFPFSCIFRALAEPTGIRLELTLTNRHTEPIPAGLGFHPFYMRHLWSMKDIVELCAPVAGRYPCDEGVPTGPAARDDTSAKLSTLAPLMPNLDDCFDGFTSPATIKYPASGVELTLTASTNLDHLVVYSPTTAAGPVPWFCAEPVSMANDGFNLMSRGVESGTAVLEPGGVLETSLSIGIMADRS